MDPKLIESYTDALLTRHIDEGRHKLLQLADKLGGLTKDLREPVAYVATEALFPTDGKVLAAYQPHRNGATSPQPVIERLRNMLLAFASPTNAFATRPEVFDLAAATLFRLQGAPEPWSAPKDLADLAIRYAEAQANEGARKPLADWLFATDTNLSEPAIRLLAPPVPGWLKQKLETFLSALRPTSVKSDSLWRRIKARLGRTWSDVRQLQPSFLLAMAALVLAMLFAVSLALAGSSKPQAAPPTASASKAADTTVFELLTRRLKDKQEILAGSTLIVSPRARDNGDVNLTEAITAANLKGVTLVHWSESRRVLGDDCPAFSRRWLMAAQLSRLLPVPAMTVKAVAPPGSRAGIDSGLMWILATAVKGDGKPPAPQSPMPVYYFDLEVEGGGPARVTVVSTDPRPGVVLVVTGAAPDLKRAVPTRWFLDRALALGGNSDAPTIGLLMEQARASATSASELAQVELVQTLMYVASGSNAQAEETIIRVWPWLTTEDKARLPEPLQRKVAAKWRTLEERVHERIELKK